MRKIEPLSKAHDRESFDCGNEALNHFVRHTARQQGERGISKTFVLVEEEAAPRRILGFFSLNICQVISEELHESEAKKLPRQAAGVKLGRLAVAKDMQGQGIGKLLLVASLRKVLEIFETAGGIGLFVDAKDWDAKRYYEQFGFVSLPSNELRLFLPLKTVQAALRGADQQP